jgi:hypothetical protein
MSDATVSALAAFLHPDEQRSSVDLRKSQVPWDKSYVLGSGVDAVSGAKCNQALVNFTLPDATPQLSFTFLKVTSKKEMEEAIKVSADGKYNIKAVTVGTSTEYMRKVSYSETQHTIVAKLTIDYPYPPKVAQSVYKLDEKVVADMATPAKFRALYGDYFISNMTRKAEIQIVYNFTATSSSEAQEFTQSLDISMKGLFSQEGAAKLDSRSKEKNVRVEINAYCFGLKEGVKLATSRVDDISKVDAVIEWFLKNAAGVPVTAELTHYSQLNPEYPTWIAMAPERFGALKGLYNHLVLLDANISDLPEFYLREVKPAFDKLNNTVKASKAQLPTAPDSEIKKLTDSADELMRKVRRVKDRATFYARVLAERKAQHGNSRGTKDTDERSVWMFGFSSDMAGQDGSVTINVDAQRLNPPDWTGAGRHEKHMSFGDGTKRLIVGMKLENNWGDSTGGRWSSDQDDLILVTSVAIKLESGIFRACDWTVTCFYVDAEDYRFEDIIQ